jgi:hypothetical protein
MTSLDFKNATDELQYFYDSTVMLTQDFINNKYSIIYRNLDDNVSKLNAKMYNYANQLTNHADLQNIYNKYVNINSINGIVDTNVKKGITNDRKSFYQAQEYDNLISWYSMFWWIYYLLAIIASLIIFLSVSPELLSFTVKCFISIFIFVYPFAISYILMPFIWVYNFIYGFYPKNVYKSL